MIRVIVEDSGLCINPRREVVRVTKYFTASGFLVFNLLKPTGHVVHQQFNIQQL